MENKTKIRRMINTIRMKVEHSSAYSGRESINMRVLKAMQVTDRGQFVPDEYKKQAYDNVPLPIGYGQTISQPYIISLMTSLLNAASDNVVLEVGSGSGYQAAILSRLVKKVYTIEIIPELAKATKKKLIAMGFENIDLKCGNGYYGWEAKSPFDAIIVTAATTHIPQNLIEQLKPGGRLVIPVGEPYSQQVLLLVTKNENSKINTESILPVSFVPLVTENLEATY